MDVWSLCTYQTPTFCMQPICSIIYISKAEIWYAI